ncbi:hypothetical protein [Streptomyces sp. NPDC059176]|uniref:hypothetical protein n=1 Tax=unclassified Streptomyces TaxID=2593676 RepID=UPI0036C11050
MGVFAMFRRKSKEAAGTSTEAVAVDTPTAESGEGAADVSADTADATKEAEAVAEAGSEAGTDGPNGTEASGASDPESVEIPKQQSPEKAADNGAGEGARQ